MQESLINILANQIQQHNKKIMHHANFGFIPEMQGRLYVYISVSVTQHKNRMKDKKITRSSQLIQKSL
jgi:hypothetical protein